MEQVNDTRKHSYSARIYSPRFKVDQATFTLKYTLNSLFCAQFVKSQFYFDSKNTKAASRLSREKMRKNLAVVFKFHSRTPTTLCLHYIRENNKLTTEKDAHTQSLTHSRTHS